jgi:dethiobiotin synthetase
MRPIFITGIGTEIGKTVIAAILVEALQADYWKPVQAGYALGTDSQFVKTILTNTASKVFPETYKLSMPAAPHLAAKTEGKTISLGRIAEHYSIISQASKLMIIEGAGGLMVPLNDNEFIIDLIKKLDARVVIVSRNYLGSINHSLLTAAVCKEHKLDVLGWVFNDRYLDYEQEVSQWSGYPVITSVPRAPQVNKAFILQQAQIVKTELNHWV